MSGLDGDRGFHRRLQLSPDEMQLNYHPKVNIWQCMNTCINSGMLILGCVVSVLEQCWSYVVGSKFPEVNMRDTAAKVAGKPDEDNQGKPLTDGHRASSHRSTTVSLSLSSMKIMGQRRSRIVAQSLSKPHLQRADLFGGGFCTFWKVRRRRRAEVLQEEGLLNPGFEVSVSSRRG